MVVGAPRAQTGQPDIIRGGAVLRCKINPHNLTGASAQFCQIIPFDDRGKEISTLSFSHLSLSFPLLITHNLLHLSVHQFFNLSIPWKMLTSTFSFTPSPPPLPQPAKKTTHGQNIQLSASLPQYKATCSIDYTIHQTMTFWGVFFVSRKWTATQSWGKLPAYRRQEQPMVRCNSRQLRRERPYFGKTRILCMFT